MGTGDQLLLSIAYLLPLALGGLLLASSSLRQGVKTLVLVLLPLFYIAHYLGSAQLGGWPSHQPLPDHFVLLGQQINEPDKRNSEPGFIRLWIQQEGQPSSRLYQLPYDKQMHQQLVGAAQRQAEGKQQVGQRQPSGTQPGSGDPSPGSEFRFEDRQSRRPPAKPSSE